MRKCIFVAVVALMGCGGTAGPSSDEHRAVDDPAAEPPPAEKPQAILTVDLANGNTLDVYDFGTAALVTESGVAGVTPMLSAAGAATPDRNLAHLFEALKPDMEVPQEIVALEQKMEAQGRPGTELSPPAVSIPAESGSRPFELPAKPEGHVGGEEVGAAREALLQGCDNGCCDPDWTRNSLCNNGGYDYNWYYFNAGYSWTNSGSISMYDGTMCSAIGTSRYSVSLGNGKGGAWDVPQQHYMNWWWVGGSTWLGFSETESLNSSVNSASNPHLHMYCGGLFYN